ncbi:FtsW/RodA/SpoVE family cell cycle protein [Corynebacterium pseudotuberculosis]|uniref:FtsW/RodA/SpoVE family cell cycle protein n=1 Tax=Corynebacterium pseudotuberculosis (strain C231) TaxID=681645 RepID=D9QD89_CORP2|nr:FtsW/RodA/SpoVE family cell cycle protein [Corynebacterium pseudotuberculosis]ADK27831.1 cell division protein FtsW [Corynebacterium pseudotuberculosis FRC41]ADL09533.1 FtsW/RodA/SpoVE family cell cycle protein [Corynebacterium pseudotuberculosis C231]ADL19944.1 FtsW/RodA/SpoVE family cell cycle protein [Corynebacterium pseudotuberculosis 1002]ADO25332.1 cell division protein FtsW [Corynebacterium pseudotuberculosis I19]AEK91384.1 Cell division protein ftsW [Corynebacterium pseudotuberculos
MSFAQRLASRRIEFGLLVLATVLIGVTLINLNMAQGLKVTTETLWVIGGFIGVFTIAHLAICFTAPNADQLMLPVASVLNGLGLVTVYRLDLATGKSLAGRQVIWTLVAIILMIVVLTVIRNHRILSRYSYILGLLGLVLLALPLVWPTKMNADANIWISIGPFSVQPGEFSKILLLLFFAQLLVNKRALFNVAGYRLLGLEFPRLRDLGPILAVWFFAILVMAGENDFGPALLLFSTVLGMLYLATNRVSWLLIGAMLVVIGGTTLYQISSKIQSRVNNFMDPLANFNGTGYQLSQSLFGLSSGGVAGSGLGQGHPELIPVAESDFILAVLGEEIGLVGLAAILVLFAIFVTRGFRTALRARDSYGKLVASGLSLTIAIQVFVVTAGITALMPMTGLTTPFMSQGGSSLMANYILLGLILRISHSAHSGQSDVAGATAQGGSSVGHRPVVSKEAQR